MCSKTSLEEKRKEQIDYYIKSKCNLSDPKLLAISQELDNMICKNMGGQK